MKDGGGSRQGNPMVTALELDPEQLCFTRLENSHGGRGTHWVATEVTVGCGYRKPPLGA